MSQDTLKKIIELLKKNNIQFEHQHHEAIPKDSLGASKVRGLNPDSGAKALVLQGKSGKFYQAIISGNLRLDFKKLKKITNEKNISMASPDDVFRLTNCIVGTVPPLGVLFDITVFVDEKLVAREWVVFSAGTSTDSIKINPKNLVKINNATVDNFDK